MCLLFNMLSSLVIAFLPRSKCLLISWLQSPSAGILELKKLKSLTVSIVSPSICHEVMGLDAMILVFGMLSLKPTFSLSSFTFIKRPFSSSSLSAVRVVSYVYLRSLIFLSAILLPACAPSSPASLGILFWPSHGKVDLPSPPVMLIKLCPLTFPKPIPKPNQTPSYTKFSEGWNSPWRRQWHPTPVLLPGKSHGWRSLAGCSPWGCEELDMTEQHHFHFSLLCIGEGNGNPLQCSCLENPRDGVT